MSINFPTSLDTLPQPGITTSEDDAGYEHDTVHTNLALAIMALQAKVGVTSSAVATSLDYLIAHLAAIANSGSASDLSAGTVAAARMPALTGDVTTTAGAVATTIANDAVTTLKILNNAVTLAKLATQADQTILGNNTGGAAVPLALTASQVRTLLALVIGTNVQAWDADLDAVSALSATAGLVARTGAGAFTQRSIVAGIGTSVNIGDGVSGNPSIDSLVMRGFFGDASDGTADPGSVSLTRSQAYGSVTIAGTLNAANFSIACSGTLTVNGTIHCNGGAGSNASGTNQGTGGGVGTTPSAGDFAAPLSSTAGATGATGAGSQASGSGSGNAFHNGVGGQGGASGLGSGGAGAAAKSATTPTASGQRRVWFGPIVRGASLLASAGGACGGSSGGGDATNVGGGGGGAGGSAGFVCIYAKNIVIGASGVISANGGNGGTGGSPTTTTGGCGGGGGGGSGNGGVVLLVYESLTITAGGVVTAATGTLGSKGTKTGTGVDGSNGTAGNAGVVLKFNLTTGAFE